MNIGKLDRRVKLLNLQTTKNAQGEDRKTYSIYRTVAAGYRALNVKEKFLSQHMEGVIEAVFTIRYISAVNEQWRIEYDGQTYEIVGPPREIGIRHEGLELHARLVR